MLLAARRPECLAAETVAPAVASAAQRFAVDAVVVALLAAAAWGTDYAPSAGTAAPLPVGAAYSAACPGQLSAAAVVSNAASAVGSVSVAIAGSAAVASVAHQAAASTEGAAVAGALGMPRPDLAVAPGFETWSAVAVAMRFDFVVLRAGSV